jgi:serine/threonine protein kinase
MKSVFEYGPLYARRILREIVLLKTLKHPYIVDLIDIIEPKDPNKFNEVYLVLELCEMDLRKFI